VRLLFIPLLFVLVSGLIALALGNQFELPGSFAESVVWLRSFERWAWAVAMAVIIGDFLLPLPSTPALVSLGIIYGPFLGGLLGGVATTAAGLLAFGLARMLGRRGALYLVGEEDLARAQRFYDRWGVYAVTLGRALGGPFEWLVLIAGISGMPFPRALLALLIGGFSGAFVVTWLGDLAVDRPVLAVTLAITLAFGLAWLARRLLRPAPPVSSP
jgi:uncharacterized membrane protein YdjX (TVP38/TMEM64 family)